METLEQRRLLAGTITVTTTGPEILITGDSEDNLLGITFTQDGFGGLSGSGRYSLSASDGRLVIDGEEVRPSMAFDSPMASSPDAWNEKHFRIALGRGDDNVYISNVHFAALTVDMGDGDDAGDVGLISQRDFVGGTPDGPTAGLRIDGGDGEDRIVLRRGIAARYGNVSLFPGFGRDHISLIGEPGTPELSWRLIVQGKLQVQDTQGPLSFSMRYADVSKQTSIITGNSIDRITLDHVSFAGAVVIGTHGGDDGVTNISSVFRAVGILAPGSGDNTLTDVDDLLE